MQRTPRLAFRYSLAIGSFLLLKVEEPRLEEKKRLATSEKIGKGKGGARVFTVLTDLRFDTLNNLQASRNGDEGGAGTEPRAELGPLEKVLCLWS